LELEFKKYVIVITIIIVIGIIVLFNFQSNTNENKVEIIEIPIPNSLFTISAPMSKNSLYETSMISQFTKDFIVIGMEFELKPELSNIYQELGFFDQNTNAVVIYPTFTESAYSENGFYDFFNSICDESCLTVTIQDNFKGDYTSSRAGHRVLQLLGYDTLTDIDVDKNPEILKKYDKVILLHNEYVTKSIFTAITSHPKVIYLYPNALYAEVKANYDNNTILLVKGHGFPEKEIKNGFNWKFDNSPMEWDNNCKNWEFYEIDNGYMLNCYPEIIIFKDQRLLETIKTK